MMLIRCFAAARYLAILLLALVIAATTYALANDNSLDQSRAGDGSAPIWRYQVVESTIHYTLDVENDPTGILQVEFTVEQPAQGTVGQPGTVQARIDTGDWVDCAPAGGSTWRCVFSSPYPQVRLNPLNVLEVMATQ